MLLALPHRQLSKPSFQPMESVKSTRLFSYCSMDFITDLPTINAFDSILFMVDQGLSKGVILIPCNKMISAEGTAKLLLKNLYKRFGLPDRIISDRGPQFASKSFFELLKLLGIKSALSTAFHPQTDGTTEWVIVFCTWLCQRHSHNIFCSLSSKCHFLLNISWNHLKFCI